MSVISLSSRKSGRSPSLWREREKKATGQMCDSSVCLLQDCWVISFHAHTHSDILFHTAAAAGRDKALPVSFVCVCFRDTEQTACSVYRVSAVGDESRLRNVRSVWGRELLITFTSVSVIEWRYTSSVQLGEKVGSLTFSSFFPPYNYRFCQIVCEASSAGLFPDTDGPKVGSKVVGFHNKTLVAD